MITTDRLETLGQGPVMDPERAMELYFQRLNDLDREVSIARASPKAFGRELLLLSNIRYWPMDEPYLSRLAVTRIVGETVAAVYSPETANLWLRCCLDDSVDVSRSIYIVRTNHEQLTSPQSQITGDLERFFF